MTDGSRTGKCPWIGPVPCEEYHARRFHGRVDELSEVIQKVKTQALTVLSAESGAGKTSLVNAGLMPVLRLVRDNDPNSMGLALCVREWGAVASANHPAGVMLQAIKESIRKLERNVEKYKDLLFGIKQLIIDLGDLKGVGNPENPDTLNQLPTDKHVEVDFETLERMELKNLEACIDNLCKRVKGGKLILIIDQAEEFMASGVKASNRRDQYLGAINVLATLVRMQGLRLVISLRDEYMGKLRPLEQQFYPLAPRTYYLQPFTWPTAKKVAILQSKDEESDIFIDEKDEYVVDLVLERVHSTIHKDRELLPVDMLAVNALLKDIHDFAEEQSSESGQGTSNGRLRIHEPLLKTYFKRTYGEGDSGSQGTLGPMLHWIDKAFETVDESKRNLVRRVAAHMWPLFSTPEGYKSQFTQKDLVRFATWKDTSLVGELDSSPNIAFEDESLLPAKFLQAAYDAVGCLIDKHILKIYGRDGKSLILALQHDGYGPAFYYWCHDLGRRENDVLISGIPTFGSKIKRRSALEKATVDPSKDPTVDLTLNKITWGGCIVEGITSKNVIFAGCDFSGSFFDECKFNDCTFQDCKFNGTFFNGGIFENVKFIGCDALGMVAKKMTWQTVNFQECNLTSAMTRYIKLGGSLHIDGGKALYTQIYQFEKAGPEGILDIKASGCNLYGALFEDYVVGDKERFKDNVVTDFITKAPPQS